MTEYTEKAISRMCCAAVLSEALRASLDRVQKPVMIATLSRDIADAATAPSSWADAAVKA